MLNRRELLVGAGAVALAAALPAEAATVAEDVVLRPPTPAWAVGSPGEFNWQHIVAQTQREALRTFVCDSGYDDFEDECSHEAHQEGCDCCEALAGFEVERKPMWDGLKETTNADWLRAGMGSLCSRCSYETFPEDGGHPVGDLAVCSECMRLDDWDIVDPKRAAELRAELED